MASQIVSLKFYRPPKGFEALTTTPLERGINPEVTKIFAEKKVLRWERHLTVIIIEYINDPWKEVKSKTS